MANAASRVAATANIAISATATAGASSTQAIDAEAVNTSPMDCAKRFGGPGT